MYLALLWTIEAKINHDLESKSSVEVALAGPLRCVALFAESHWQLCCPKATILLPPPTLPLDRSSSFDHGPEPHVSVFVHLQALREIGILVPCGEVAAIASSSVGSAFESVYVIGGSPTPWMRN